MKLRPDSLALAVLLTALVAFGPVSTDMYLPSLPGLAAFFGTDIGRVQLTLSVFLVGFAVSQLVYGPLSDRFGRRPVILAGVALFLLGSVACTLAPSIEVLIGARFVQAVGACSGPVLARAVVRDVYGRERAARVLAYMGTAMALAPALAPILGGYLHVWFGWRANFVFLSAYAMLMLLSVWLWLGETNLHRDPGALQPGRLVGNYAALLGNGSYLGYVLSLAFMYSGLFAWISGSPFVLIEHFGVATEVYGLFFGFVVAGYMTGTISAARLTHRLGIERMILIGSGIGTVAGFAMAAFACTGTATLALIVLPMFLFAAGMGIVMPNGMAGAIGPFPRMAGTASALLGFLQMSIAAAVGIGVARLHDGTPASMAGFVALCGLGALVCFLLLTWRRGGAAHGSAD